MIEHLKETNTSWHNSHSFGMNFGAMLNFANIPSVTNGMMVAPVVRNEKGYSIEETLSKSGIYAKENHIEIGEKIEITPTLRNEEKISVFDTSIINSISGIASGVQEIKENWEAIHKPQYHDIIIDTEPVDVGVITEASKEGNKPVIADVEPKIPEKQENFSIRQDELHEIIDEIYYEDIAPYHEFERAGSPDRVETELTKAVGKVQDVANGLANASDFSNMPDPIIGADSDPQSMVALGKGVMKVAEFAGEIFGTIIEPAANAIGTKVRRILRDDLSVSQARSQDIGDITHLVAGILIPGGTAKVISKTGKLTSFGKAVMEKANLDKVNKVPYNPRAMESLFKQSYGAENVVSSTMPKSNAKNVKLANSGKVVTIGIDEITEEQITKHIPFNSRGLPVFDDICVCDLRLPENIAKVKSRDFHFKHATLELKNLIETGQIDRTIFSRKQLQSIYDEEVRIPGLTWHHHEDIGRMQLISRDVHKGIGHFGGFDLWFK